MKRSTATHLRYARRDRKVLAAALDRAAADLSTIANAAVEGRPIRPSDLRERSSNYAKLAHRFGPRRGE
jgi:hypothetical protein